MDLKLLEEFKFLSTEARDLYVPRQVQCISAIPSSLKFLRKWVAGNIPLLIKGGAQDWECMKKWNVDYLISVLGDKKVTIAVTPNGYADAISTCHIDGKDVEMFVLPEERSIAISDLFKKLQGSKLPYTDNSVAESQGIFYLQKQNSNLTEEFPELLKDIDVELEWASEAFGEKPNAINLWIGDQRSITSMHKDPFENIYCVVSGWKDFILLPPTDRPWLPYKTLPVAEYLEVSPGNFEVHLKQQEEGAPNEVPWITIDPCNPDLEKHPLYANASPIKVRVEAGDLLYLPSLWYHHVRQSDNCIAVNYWYDMAMDIKFAYFQFLEQLVNACQNKERNGKEKSVSLSIKTTS